MKSIYSILNVLRKGEIELIKHYYTRPVNAENKMRLSLLETALHKKGLANSEAILELREGMSTSAFSHLKRRLKKDMLNALLWQESEKRFAESYLAGEFECTKNISQAYVLLLRGNTKEGLKLLESARKLAQKFELVTHRITINQLIRRRFDGIKNARGLKDVNIQLLSDIENISRLNFAEENTLLLATPQLFPKGAGDVFRKTGSDVLNELKLRYTDSGLSRVGFWYYMAATEFYRSNGMFEEMLDHGMGFFKLVNESDSLRSDPNVSGVSQTVGTAMVRLHRFKEAEEYLEISVQKFREGGINQLASLELLFKAQMATYGTFRSKETVDKGLLHRRTGMSERLGARWNYFKACREFLSSKPDQSYTTLNSNGDLMKWKDDLNVQFRILEVLQLIELEDYDWIDFKLDTLRKFVSRNRKLKSSRVDGIIKVLHAIQAKSYDLTKLNNSTLEVIKKLHSNEKGWGWNPLGFELVRFDAWIERKIG
ncbi:MAG: hypothetical protein ACI9FU_000279 [Granulosicoccus sp.]|jgi:hypothetical protein